MGKHKTSRPHDERSEHDSDGHQADRAGDAELGAHPREEESRTADRASALSASELAQMQSERDEYLANWQRAQADYQNLRRRLQSDTDAAVLRAKAPLLQDLLLVMDYLDMALSTPCTTSECKSLLAGIELTKSVLTRALQREGVEPVAEGGVFDSAVHQAVERTESPGVEAGRVLQTLRRGYTQNGQVLRPAQVRVAVDAASAAGDEDQGSAANDAGGEH